MKMKAVINAACTKTVAGEPWLENYMEKLDETLINQVEISENHKIFKLGDGCKSYWRFKIRITCTSW